MRLINLLLTFLLFFALTVLVLSSPTIVEIEGELQDGGDVGYFTLGNDVMIAVRPDSDIERQLATMVKSQVRIVVEGQR